VKQLFLVVLGILIGIVASHQVARTAAGARLLAAVDQGTKAFTGAVADGYRSREAELRTDA
jgi:hypothetical protein